MRKLLIAEHDLTHWLPVLLMLILFSCGSAVAPAAEPHEFEDDVAWIEANSDLTWEGEELPRYVYVPRETIENLCGELCAGTYDPYSHTMYISADMKPETIRTTLFHEHVHVVQYSQESVPLDTCAGRLEPLAYDLEEQWSEEQGFEFTGDKFEGYMARSRCETIHH